MKDAASRVLPGRSSASRQCATAVGCDSASPATPAWPRTRTHTSAASRRSACSASWPTHSDNPKQLLPKHGAKRFIAVEGDARLSMNPKNRRGRAMGRARRRHHRSTQGERHRSEVALSRALPDRGEGRFAADFGAPSQAGEFRSPMIERWSGRRVSCGSFPRIPLCIVFPPEAFELGVVREQFDLDPRREPVQLLLLAGPPFELPPEYLGRTRSDPPCTAACRARLLRPCRRVFPTSFEYLLEKLLAPVRERTQLRTLVARDHERSQGVVERESQMVAEPEIEGLKSFASMIV